MFPSDWSYVDPEKMYIGPPEWRRWRPLSHRDSSRPTKIRSLRVTAPGMISTRNVLPIKTGFEFTPGFPPAYAKKAKKKVVVLKRTGINLVSEDFPRLDPENEHELTTHLIKKGFLRNRNWSIKPQRQFERSPSIAAKSAVAALLASRKAVDKAANQTERKKKASAESSPENKKPFCLTGSRFDIHNGNAPAVHVWNEDTNAPCEFFFRWSNFYFFIPSCTDPYTHVQTHTHTHTLSNGFV